MQRELLVHVAVEHSPKFIESVGRVLGGDRVVVPIEQYDLFYKVGEFVVWDFQRTKYVL